MNVATHIQQQNQYTAHLEFGAENPDFMWAAIRAINAWERGEYTLAHSIALEMKTLWEMGSRGELPKAPAVVTMVRRTRPEPTKPSARTGMIRRSR